MSAEVQNTGRIVSVNVGTPREFELKGKRLTSSIWKRPVEGRVRVWGVNIAGDDQADRSVHGGHDKAIYAYAVEDYMWWETHLGASLGPGTFGENLTVSSLDVNRALVGERWKVGTAVLEITQPRLPCFKLGIRMGEENFPHRFSQAARWGAYLAIIDEGEVGAGDVIETLSRPDHGITVTSLANVYYGDHSRASELLAAPSLPEGWRTWAEKQARRAV